LKGDCGGLVQCTQARFNSDSGDVKTFETLAVAGWLVGGAAMTGGLLWYAMGAPSQSTGFRWQLNPVARTVGVGGAF
jgi:hypothetical protein